MTENLSFDNEEDYLYQVNSVIEEGNINRIKNYLKQNVKFPKETSKENPIIKLIDNKKKSDSDKEAILKLLLLKDAAKIIDKDTESNILQSLIYKINIIRSKDDRSPEIKDLYKFIEIILNHNIELINEVDSSNMNAVSKAVEFGDEKLVEILLKYGANPNSLLWGENEHSLLEEAIEQNNIPIIKLILKHDSIKIQPEIALKLLNKAIEHDKQDLIKLLGKDELKIFDSNTLEAIIKNHQQESHFNPTLAYIVQFINDHKALGNELISSIRNNKMESAIALIKAGAWCNVNKDGDTALIFAAQNGDIEVVKALLKAGADLSLQYKNGSTALEFAAQQGHTEVVKILLEAGADSNLQNNDGYTALMFAARNGHIEAVKALLKAGADLSLQYKNGSTALEFAAQQGHTEVVKVLLDYGADSNLRNRDGDTALMFAAQKGHIEAVKVLLEAGAIPNRKNLNGYTALFVAAANGYVEVVNALLKAGANPNLQDTDGKTALMFAAEKSHIEVLDALLKAGANANLQNNSSNTALMHALMYDSQYLIRRSASKILEYNVDINIKNNNGMTAMDFARDDAIKKILKAKSKSNVEIEKKLDKKIDQQINKAFKDLLKDQDFNTVFIENKLSKYMGLEVKQVAKLFQDKAIYVKDKNVKIDFTDLIKSIFKGREKVKFEKALKEIKTSIYKSEDYETRHKEQLENKLKKPLKKDKGKS